MMIKLVNFLLISTSAFTALSFGNTFVENNKNIENQSKKSENFTNKIDYQIKENFLLKPVREGKEWENGSSNQILLLDWKKHTENQTWEEFINNYKTITFDKTTFFEVKTSLGANALIAPELRIETSKLTKGYWNIANPFYKELDFSNSNNKIQFRFLAWYEDDNIFFRYAYSGKYENLQQENRQASVELRIKEMIFE